MAARIRAALIPTIVALTLAFCAYAQLRPEVTVKPKPKKPIAVRAPRPGTASENEKDGLRYVWIPPGTFMMGCSPEDRECEDDEKPAHRVTITKGFWLGQTEVTVGAYKRFAAEAGKGMPELPDFNPGSLDDYMPIVNVGWGDAEAYCRWAGGRLPTEAEWEYAARGGSTEARYGEIDSIAWYNENSGGRTHDVGGKRANRFGLYDMLGNVWQWANDWWKGDYYQNSPPEDPHGPTSSVQNLRVLRRGSWADSPRYARVSSRFKVSPGTRRSHFGFRCVGESAE